MSSWFTSHGDDVGMTSSCSHHTCIMLMMSSHSDHDIIVTCMNHDFSHGARQTDSSHNRQTFMHDIDTMTNDRQTYVRPRDFTWQADLCT